MYERMHFHEGGVSVSEESMIMERLERKEVVAVPAEGYWKLDLQFPTSLIQKTGASSWKEIGEAQAIGVIPARMSRMYLFKDLPILELIFKMGYKTILEFQDALFRLYRPKPFIDWFSIIFFINKNLALVPVMPDSHYHLFDPVTVDRNYFMKMGVGKIIVSIEEGCHITPLNSPLEIRSYDGELLGYGEVVPLPTRVSCLHYLADFLPIEHILKAATGRSSAEYLTRSLIARYPGKRDLDWITIKTVHILEKSELPII